MPTTVNSAFNQFMADSVNLDSKKTITARSSRDYLRGQVKGLTEFFPLYSDKDVNFGSLREEPKFVPWMILI